MTFSKLRQTKQKKRANLEHLRGSTSWEQQPNQVTPSPNRQDVVELQKRSTPSSLARKQLFRRDDKQINSKKEATSRSNKHQTSASDANKASRSRKQLFGSPRNSSRGRPSLRRTASASSLMSSSVSSSLLRHSTPVSPLVMSKTRKTNQFLLQRKSSSATKPRLGHRRERLFSSMDSLASIGSKLSKMKKECTSASRRKLSSKRKGNSTPKETRRGRPKKKPIRHKHGLFNNNIQSQQTSFDASTAGSSTIEVFGKTIKKNKKKTNVQESLDFHTRNSITAPSSPARIPDHLKDLVRPLGLSRKPRTPKDVLQEFESNKGRVLINRRKTSPRSCKKDKKDYSDDYDEEEFSDSFPIKEVQTVSLPSHSKDKAPKTTHTVLQQEEEPSSASSTNRDHREAPTEDNSTPRSRQEREEFPQVAEETIATIAVTAASPSSQSPPRSFRFQPRHDSVIIKHDLLLDSTNEPDEGEGGEKEHGTKPSKRSQPRTMRVSMDSKIHTKFPSFPSSSRGPKQRSPATISSVTRYNRETQSSRSSPSPQQEEELAENLAEDTELRICKSKLTEGGNYSLRRSPRARKSKMSGDDDIDELDRLDKRSANSMPGSREAVSKDRAAKSTKKEKRQKSGASKGTVTPGIAAKQGLNNVKGASNLHTAAPVDNMEDAEAQHVVTKTTKKKSKTKEKKATKSLSLSQRKTALKKTKKMKERKSKVRFADPPERTTTFSIKIRVSTSGINSSSSTSGKGKKNKKQPRSTSVVEPLSESAVQSIANQITKACLSQAGSSNSIVVDGASSCDASTDDSSSKLSSEPSRNAVDIDDSSVVNNVGDDELATCNEEINFSQENWDQIEEDSALRHSDRTNLTSIVERTAEERSSAEENAEEEDEVGFAADDRSVTSDLSMPTLQSALKRSELALPVQKSEIAKRNGRALEPAAGGKSKTMKRRSASVFAESQTGSEVVGKHRRRHDCPGNTHTGTVNENEKSPQKRKRHWSRKKRLRGGDSLAGSVESFLVSPKRAKRGTSPAYPRCKSRRLVCSDSLAGTFLDDLAPLDASKNIGVSKVPMEVRIRDRSEKSVSHMKASAIAPSSGAASITEPNSSNSFREMANSNDEVDETVVTNFSTESSPTNNNSRRIYTTEICGTCTGCRQTFDCMICDQCTERLQFGRFCRGNYQCTARVCKFVKRRQQRDSLCQTTEMSQESRSECTDRDNPRSKAELESTLSQTSKNPELLPSRAALYWSRKFAERTRNVSNASATSYSASERDSSVNVVKPRRKTRKRGKSKWQKNPLHEMELPIPCDASIASFRQSRKSLKALMHYDEADQDWV